MFLSSSPLHVSPLANPLPACFSSQIHCLHVVPTRKSTACMFLSSQIPCLHVSPTRARTLDSKKKELFDVLQAFIGVFSDEMWRIAIESLSSEPAHFALSSEGLPPAGRANIDWPRHPQRSAQQGSASLKGRRGAASDVSSRPPRVHDSLFVYPFRSLGSC
ncbi:hypothetical protein PAPYR_9217 [Paratrimastix pyriformis]|uniref:Uncharacterized protein n=1 Tax=Paratrimastix pyriformis TaxID=342808 RepID=A0ABQ8U8V1_9EUKA|nr:hypothetical protein PAPYR_9217 [Paratrimastix pyriformis]